MKEKIPILSGDIENDIREGYFGGHVDMYKPINELGEQIFCYDANSLFPSEMSKQLMPVGNPIYFEGDIRKYEPDALGFFYCKIQTPEYLEHPILLRKIKTKDGLRTIAGLRSW